MNTAVTAAPAPEESRGPKQGPDSVKPVKGAGWAVYKPGEGYASRLGMMAVVMAYTFFACHHFYYNWVLVRDVFDAAMNGVGLGVLSAWAFNEHAANFIGVIGTTLIAIAGFAIGYYYIYVNARSAEFLIKTDGELNKVTWPKMVPWFKVETQVWGSTYVVLIVVTALTVYVFGVDFILQKIAQVLFYRSSR